MGAPRRRLVVAGEQGLIRSSFGQFRRVIISRTCVHVPAFRLLGVGLIGVGWTGVGLALVLGFAGSEGSSRDFGGVDGSSRTSWVRTGCAIRFAPGFSSRYDRVASWADSSIR